MAIHVLKNASVTVNSVDLSDHVKTVRITTGADAPDGSAMGANTRIGVAGGLKNWSIEIDFEQDYAASKVDATCNALPGTATAVVVLPDGGTATTANPSYTGTAIWTGYDPIGGSVGDLHMTRLTGTAASDLTRATT